LLNAGQDFRPSSFFLANSRVNHFLDRAIWLLSRPNPGAEIWLRQAFGAILGWRSPPNGPFSAAPRLYWPKEEALDGRWQQPALEKAKAP
jgi:hypothetical protein